MKIVKIALRQCKNRAEKNIEMRDESFCLLVQTANTMKTRIYSH